MADRDTLEATSSRGGLVRVGGVHHIAVQARDLERSRSFYCDLLGMRETRRQPHAIWVQADDVIVMLEKCDGAAAQEPWVTAREGLHLLALRIDATERAAWKERLTNAGVTLEKESAFTLYVRDPDGTRVGLSHYPDPS